MTRKQVSLAALLTTLWALLMGAALKVPALAPYPFPPRFHQDVASPVLALELARGAEDIRNVLPDGRGRATLRARWALFVNTALDVVLIPLYVWCLIRLVRAVRAPGRLRTAACVLALLAGAADLVENGCMLAAIRGAAVAVMVPSLVKWGLLGIALLLIGVAYAQKHEPLFSLATDRMLSITLLYAGGLLVFGVMAGSVFGYSWIQNGAMVMGSVLLVTGGYLPLLLLRRLLPL